MFRQLGKKAFLLWTILVAACTVQLVPAYDASLAQGLDQANTTALTLFAAVDGGSTSADFAPFAPRYAEVIGRFEALREHAASRPIPPLAARLAKVGVVRDFCNAKSDATSCVNVSPSSLDRVLAVLRMMRDTHRSAGLAGDTVALFHRDYAIAVDQALTIETALKR